MQLSYRFWVIVVVLFLTGCSTMNDYVWSEYPIARERISPQASFAQGKEVSIIAGKSDNTKVYLGRAGGDEYYGSMQVLADAIAVQLTAELQLKGVRTTNKSGKSLEITVTRINYDEGMWKFAAIIDVAVKFGNGKTKPYTVRNSSPASIPRIYNGVVALSVVQIINDAEVIKYINE